MEKNKGFTLLELMVTLAVLAILIGIAAPSFSSIIKERKLVHATEELRSQLLFAKGEAVKQNADVTFFFSSTNGWCAGVTDQTITNGNDCDCADVTAQCSVSDTNLSRAFSSTEFPGLSFSSTASFTNNLITIKPRSGEMGSGHIKVSLSDDSSRVRCIMVTTLGRVRTCDPAAATCGSCS